MFIRPARYRAVAGRQGSLGSWYTPAMTMLTDPPRFLRSMIQQLIAGLVLGGVMLPAWWLFA